jgi:hypothetical protein
LKPKCFPFLKNLKTLTEALNLSDFYPEISEVQQLTAEIQELLSGLAWSYPCEPPSQRLLTHLNDIE